MSKEMEKKLVPMLRFPEFKNDDGWHSTSIGEVGKFYYGKSAPKWSLSKDAPTLCVRYGELYTKFDTIITKVISRTNIDPSNLRFSKGGEILVPRVGEVPRDFAENVCYLPFPNIAIGEMISVYNTKEYPIFYAHYFRTLWREFAKVVEGQNVKNLYYVNLEPIVIGKPSYLEQQKIAECLSSLDDLITAENEKLDVLKNHKKGLMQRLFPAEGEKVPKLRFSEFKDSGDWELLPIGSKIKLLSGYAFKSHEITGDVSGTRLLRGINVTEGRIRHSNDIDRYFLGSVEKLEKFKVKKNDLVIAMDGSKVGKNAALITDTDEGALLVQRVARLRANSEAFIKYIFHQINAVNFHTYVDKINTSSGIPHISADQIKNFNIYFPPSDDELEKTESFITGLNVQITEQTKKIDELKFHKKGLMQQLFPTIN
jgi:type I restriction enzyme S subunit